MKRRLFLIVAAVLALVFAGLALAETPTGVNVSNKNVVAPLRLTSKGDVIAVPYPLLCTPTTGSCVGATATSTDYTLPTTGSRIFRITGGGGLASYAFIKCGVGTQTASTTAATGHNGPPVMDGQSLPPREFPSTYTKCAVVGGVATGGAAAAGGEVCFEQCNLPTGFAFGS
jgi:hypothetical protein